MFHLKSDEYLLNTEQKKMLKKAFNYATSDPHKHLLYKTDCKVAWLYLFGYKISKNELQEYFELLEKDYYKDGLSYDEFERKAENDVRRLDITEETRNAFMTWDFSCQGFLTIDDFYRAFNLIAPNITQKTIKNIFKEIDSDLDGRISYKDFEFAMLYFNDEIDSDLKTKFLN